MTHHATLISIRSFLQDYREVLVQVLFWILFFLMINVDWQAGWVSRELSESRIRPISAVVFFLSFYANAYFLIPRFLKTKKWWQYGIGVLLLGPFFEFWSAIGSVLVKNGLLDFGNIFLAEFMNFRHINDPVFFGILFSCAYVFTKDWMLNIGLVEKLRAEKLSSELSFLKSQVDPHFLFNTLNTLYALALEENGHRTADAIAKLGTLMRYSLHDSQVDFISLSKEVAYIQEYLALQGLRITSKNTIEFQMPSDIEHWQAVRIPPMLFLPFIENAFKYGISPVHASFIKIQIKMEAGNLSFLVENSLIDRPEKQEYSGLGIENVRQRLELIYPKRYHLNFGVSDQKFYVHLTLNLPT